MPIRKIEVFQCKVCGHEWIPRRAEPPKQCPNRACGSPNWQTGKGKRPPISEQRRKAAKKRDMIHKIESGEIALVIPITETERRAAMAVWGNFISIKEPSQIVQVRTTNAGDWNDITESEGEWLSPLELLGFDARTDELWRVNTNIDDGQCLIGDDIFPGDVIHFRGDRVPENGDIVLARGFDVSGRHFATAKHYYSNGLQHNGQPVIELRSSNPDIAPIQAFPFNVEVVGVCINILRLGARKGTRHKSGKKAVSRVRQN